jgi:hypothetical protein
LTTAAPTRTRLFWTGSATFVLIGAAAALYGPALPAFARLNGIGLAEAALIVSAHNLGGLAGLAASALLGLGSARLALALLSLGAGLIASGAGWPVTLAGGAVLGAGYAMVTAVYNRRFLLETGPRGPAMVGVLNAIFGFGAIGGPLLFVALGGAPALAFGAVALGAAALVPLAGATPPGAAEPSSRAEDGAAAPRRRPAVLALGTLAVGFETLLVGLGPAALVGRGIGEAEAVVLASLFFGCFLAMRFALFWLALRFAPLTLLAVGFAAAGTLVGLASVLPPGPLFAAAGAATGLIFPSYYVAATGSLGTAPRASALIVAAANVGAILLPAAASLAIALQGAAVMLPFAAAVGLGAALATLVLARRA